MGGRVSSLHLPLHSITRLKIAARHKFNINQCIGGALKVPIRSLRVCRKRERSRQEVTFSLLCPKAMPQSDKFDSLNGTVVVPGDKIVKWEPILKAGRGSAIMHSWIYSTLLGYILDVTANEATCTILAVKDKPVRDCCSGVINKEDTVPRNKKDVNVLKFVGFRDIVVAKVVGVEPGRVYRLSIRERSFGVMFGYCFMGHKMFGCSNRAIRCEDCCIEEERKVAAGSRILAVGSLSSRMDDGCTNGHVERKSSSVSLSNRKQPRLKQLLI
ncbi:hypothetical protein M513_02637 [Trichuris suis]|uniref:Exosome complex component CSL4 C-terminal domain-containing protein n=1 Tax=Trichuris suis TaxID=68888 RepID=A0A085MH37_9BILA|nr:hypothetical protein M513_02637 [Trichuris suis]